MFAIIIIRIISASLSKHYIYSWKWERTHSRASSSYTKVQKGEPLDNDGQDDDMEEDGYSSPDIDYEEVANYEQNSPESTKIHAKHKDQGNESPKNVDSDKSDDLYNYDPGCDYE